MDTIAHNNMINMIVRCAVASGGLRDVGQLVGVAPNIAASVFTRQYKNYN